MARRYHMQPQHPARLRVAEPQVSLRALVTSTDFQDRKNSATVRLRNIREVRPPRALSAYRVLKGMTLTAENLHQHEVRLFCKAEDLPLNPDSRVLVDCSCGRYCFYYEVANADQGVGFIYRSNGAPPSTNNPTGQIGLCVDGDAWVTTDKGPVPLRQIKVGDVVLTGSGFSPVVAKSNSGVQRTKRITLRSGERVRVTADHLVGISNNYGKLGWKPAGDLAPQDHVFCQSLGGEGVKNATVSRLSQVTAVEEGDEVETFDIEVLEGHSFVANGILVHNCKHLYRMCSYVLRTMGNRRPRNDQA